MNKHLELAELISGTDIEGWCLKSTPSTWQFKRIILKCNLQWILDHRYEEYSNLKYYIYAETITADGLETSFLASERHSQN